MLTQATLMRPSRWLSLVGATAVILGIFGIRTALAQSGNPPRLDEIFTLLTLLGSLVLALTGWLALRPIDWLLALGVGALIGGLMTRATLFMPYPFLGIDTTIVQSVIRGVTASLALLGGLTVMRRGGPVRLSTADSSWRRGLLSLGFGALVGAPLAVLNMYALSWTQGQPFVWQSLPAAIIDALQPAVVEELVYRFALLGLLWLVLQPAWPRHAGWIAGLLALIAHNWMHFDEVLVAQPLTALVMGLVMAVIWGLPMTALALRRDLESAIGFHWIQDVLRLLAGF